VNVADFFENFQLEIVFLGILVASEVTFFELEIYALEKTLFLEEISLLVGIFV